MGAIEALALLSLLVYPLLVSIPVGAIEAILYRLNQTQINKFQFQWVRLRLGPE